MAGRNYARFLPVYLAEMQQMERTHPGVALKYKAMYGVLSQIEA